jgi:hypothetical protein
VCMSVCVYVCVYECVYVCVCARVCECVRAEHPSVFPVCITRWVRGKNYFKAFFAATNSEPGNGTNVRLFPLTHS